MLKLNNTRGQRRGERGAGTPHTLIKLHFRFNVMNRCLLHHRRHYHKTINGELNTVLVLEQQ